MEVLTEFLSCPLLMTSGCCGKFIFHFSQMFSAVYFITGLFMIDIKGI